MNYDSIDFAVDGDGDYVLSTDGDLLDTAFDPLLGIVQAVRNRVRYLAGDWRQYPDLGLPYRPIGDLNTPDTAAAWENAIIASLVQDGLLASEDITLTSVPLSEITLLTLIEVRVEPTEFNGHRTLARLYAIYDHNEQVVNFH